MLSTWRSSIPGYGYSGKPVTTGWDAPHIARAWVLPMKRLGYTKFVAQGGDWGAVITEQMGPLAPPALLGIHTNVHGVFPDDINDAAFSGAPPPAVSQPARNSLTSVCSYCARRRCTESWIHRSAWRLISSITTRAAMNFTARVLDGQSEAGRRKWERIPLRHYLRSGLKPARIRSRRATAKRICH
jgi:hypothetical protein